MQQRIYLEVGVAYRIRSRSAILQKIIYLHLTRASEGKKGVFLSYQKGAELVLQCLARQLVRQTMAKCALFQGISFSDNFFFLYLFFKFHICKLNTHINIP